MKNRFKTLNFFYCILLFWSCTNSDINIGVKQNKIQNSNDTIIKKPSIEDSSIKYTRHIDKYKDLVNNYISDLKKNNKISKKLILQCFPRTENEYLFLYSLTTKNDITFEKLNNDLFQLANSDYDNAYFYYLSMIEFVDGEYADFFLQNIDVLVNKHNKRICSIYPELSEYVKNIVNSYYLNFCK